MQRVFEFLRTDDIPPMTRPNFVRERAHYMIWALVVGAVEGNLAGIVVKKTFGASDTLTSIVWAAPIFMMSLNVFWGIMIRGRRRKQLLLTLTCCATVLIGTIAFASPKWTPWGGWIFAGQIGLTHLFISGLITLRSSMWQVNYPGTHRGRIIGRLQTIRFLFVPLSGAVVAAQFDLDPDHYRLVYPSVAALGLLSLVPLRGFRVRAETREIREYRRHLRDGAPTERSAAPRLWTGVVEAFGILRHDHAFRRYMTAQFTLGAANFFTDPVLLAVVTGTLAFDYFTSNLIMAVIPGICSWLAIRFWAPYFDRVGVLRFRVTNCILWVAAYTSVALSMLIIGASGTTLLWVAIPLLVMGRVLKGTAHGGGLIAWSIGHLRFARQHQVDLYMSIHVALTGVRALLMPQLGLLANRALGNGSFAIAIAISAAALWLFHRLARADAECTDPRNRHGASGSSTGSENTAPAPRR